MWRTTLLFLTSVAMLQAQDSSITFLPDAPRCIGEEVEMICYVESGSLQFILSTASISLNGSRPIVFSTFNGLDIINGIDTSRYTASITDLSISSSRPGVRVTISDYQASDGFVVFGCAGLLANLIPSDILIQGQPQRLAIPPSPPVSLTADFNSLTCFGVQLVWTPGATDKDIQMYFLYQNGNEIASLGSVTSYSHPTTLQIDMTYTYSVVAMSCAGNSTHTNADPIYVGNPPSSPNVTLSQPYSTYPDIIISWSTPDSDRNITSYTVSLNSLTLSNQMNNQVTDTIPRPVCTEYEYSVVAVSCAGFSTPGVSTIKTGGYTLSTFDITYNDTNGIASVNWDLNRYGDSQIISIDYTFRVNYTYYQNRSSEYNANSSFMLSQLSNYTSYDVNLDNVTFPAERTVITVCMEVTQHCGVTFIREPICREYDSVPPTPTPTKQPEDLIIAISISVPCCCCCCCCFPWLLLLIFTLCLCCKKDDKGYSIFGSKKRSDSQEMTDQKFKNTTEPAASEKPILYVDIDHTLTKPETIKRHEPIEETHYTTVQNL